MKYTGAIVTNMMGFETIVDQCSIARETFDEAMADAKALRDAEPGCEWMTLYVIEVES